MENKKITIVISMHRSGSSLVANILHASGIHMGDNKTFKPKPNETNAKGFYENIRFRKINDKLLKNSVYDVKSWNTTIPTVKPSKPLRKEIKTLLEEYSSKYERFGFKDPRTCLTWEEWSLFLKPENTRIVYCYRNPNAVANSLINRGNITSVDIGLKLWQVYNERALPITDTFYTVFVNYDNLLETGKISGIDCQDSIIDTSLRHNNVEEIPESCKDLWNRILEKDKQNA